MENKIYQGLTIDGGGILGIGVSKALMEFEKRSGKPIIEQFDFIAGTSTGGIITVLLGLGYSAEEIFNMYKNEGRDIFYIPNLAWKLNPFKPKYSTERFEKILDKYCGTKTMKDLKLPCYVTTSNIVKNETHVFSNKHNDLLKEVVLRTTAAPTYFPPRGEWVDGGIWANDPALVGTLGFKRDKKIKMYQMKILSLGTTGDFQKKVWKTDKMTIAHWIMPLMDFLLQGSEYATEFFMKQLDLADYERIDPIMKIDWQMDDMKIMDKFSDRWSEVYSNNKRRFKKFFR